MFESEDYLFWSEVSDRGDPGQEERIVICDNQNTMECIFSLIYECYGRKIPPYVNSRPAPFRVLQNEFG